LGFKGLTIPKSHVPDFCNLFYTLLPWLVVIAPFVKALRLCTGRTAHRGSKGIALPFHDHGTRRGERSASRPGRCLPRGKTRYPLYNRLGGPQGWSGQVRKISPPPGFDPWSIHPVASRYTDHATRPTLFYHRYITLGP